jgi:hypothetical protein
MPEVAAPFPAITCPICGGPNACAPAACGRVDVKCWCTDAKIEPAALARVPESQRGRACLCERCAAGGALPAIR